MNSYKPRLRKSVFTCPRHPKHPYSPSRIYHHMPTCNCCLLHSSVDTVKKIFEKLEVKIFNSFIKLAHGTIIFYDIKQLKRRFWKLFLQRFLRTNDASVAISKTLNIKRYEKDS